MELACEYFKSMENNESKVEFICQSINMFVPDEWCRIVHDSILLQWTNFVEIGLKLV